MPMHAGMAASARQDSHLFVTENSPPIVSQKLLAAPDITLQSAEPRELSTLDWALRYYGLGFTPIPIPIRNKAPQLSGWQNTRYTDEQAVRDQFGDQAANIGVVLGQASGGLVDIDLDCPEAIAVADIILPPTPMVFGRASKLRSHYLYRVTGSAKSVRFVDPADGSTLIELRGEGAQTVFPGSIHPSGEPIAFDEKWDGSDLPADIPYEELKAAASKLAAIALIAKHWGRGSRHRAALALSGALLRARFAPDLAAEFIRAVATAANDEEVEDRVACVQSTKAKLDAGENVTGWPDLSECVGEAGVAKVRTWLGVNDQPTRFLPLKGQEVLDGEILSGKPALRCTDLGNAERYAWMHEGRVAYCHSRKIWFVYDGCRWRADKDGEPYRLADAVISDIFRDAAATRDPGEQQRLGRWGVVSASNPRINAMVDIARNRLTIDESALDEDPWLLNCASGTLDLRTGQLMDHSPRQLISKLTPVAYDPKAQCPTWRRFLHQVMAGNEAMIRFLQKAIGYSLTGDTREQCLFILYGTGANGKSTFLNVLREMLGDYAQQTPMDTLLQRSNQSARNDVARLRGARFVVASEANHGQRLDEALVKQLTGGDSVTARFLYADLFSFVPQCKLFLATNHRPDIRGVEDAIWRRVRLIPFTVTIPENERDPTLPEQLRAELPGILAWAVEGCRLWHAEGLVSPPDVVTATEAYRHESNPIRQFIDECCVVRAEAGAPSTELYGAYQDWCGRSGVDLLAQKQFGQTLGQLGYRDDRRRINGQQVRVRLGIDLNDTCKAARLLARNLNPAVAA